MRVQHVCSCCWWCRDTWSLSTPYTSCRQDTYPSPSTLSSATSQPHFCRSAPYINIGKILLLWLTGQDFVMSAANLSCKFDLCAVDGFDHYKLNNLEQMMTQFTWGNICKPMYTPSWGKTNFILLKRLPALNCTLYIYISTQSYPQEHLE